MDRWSSGKFGLGVIRLLAALAMGASVGAYADTVEAAESTVVCPNETCWGGGCLFHPEWDCLPGLEGPPFEEDTLEA
jgi:hypothetical protein